MFIGRRRIKSLSSMNDQHVNVNVKLTNKFEPLNMLEPKIVAQFEKHGNRKPKNKKCKKVLLL
jgi:hypothetical protein